MELQYLYISLIVVFSGLSIYFYKELNKERKDNNENKRLLKKSFNFLNGYSQIQHNSENEFAKVVEKFNDPKWFVYRNVRWQWRKGGSINNPMNEGEVDFLLVHRDLGVVLIEVKGGKGWRYNATKDIWTIKTPNGVEEAPGPYNQLSRNAMGLRNRIQYESNKLGFRNFRPRINTFVVWANVNSDESKFGFIGYENNTIYADEFLNPETIEEKIKKQFTLNDYKDDDLVLLFNKILNSNVKGFSLLSYSGKIADKVEKISEEIFNTYYEITNEKYKKVKIQGIPGSGKTFIATKLAEHEEKHGRKVLFLCYNILLGKKLKSLFENSSKVSVLIFEEFINKIGILYEDEVEINGEIKLLKNLSKIEEVEYIKKAGEKKFAIIDAGMNDLIRPSLYEAWHKVIEVDHQNTDLDLYDLAGPVCETGDVLAKDRDLKIMAGDHVAFMDVGAYGSVMTSNYNSRLRPIELLVTKDKVQVIKRKESFEDIVALET